MGNEKKGYKGSKRDRMGMAGKGGEGLAWTHFYTQLGKEKVQQKQEPASYCRGILVWYNN